MNQLIDAALGHARTIILILVLVLTAGAVAYVDIPKESEPDVNIPNIYVVMKHEGISPEDAEQLLLRPMEQGLRAIEGVMEMKSSAREGSASVTLKFDAGFDVDKALSDVRDKVDLVKVQLPDDTDEPTVHEINISLFPVILVTLSGNVPEHLLVRAVRDMQEEIEGISSVLEAEIVGERDELLEILIDPILVESYGIKVEEAIALVRKSNLLVAAGAQDTGLGRFSLKVPGLLKTATDIQNLPVQVLGDAVVRLRDIAEVRRTFRDPDGFARVNGEKALAIEVVKRTGENIIGTIEQVRTVVTEAKMNWPKGLRASVAIGFSQDKSGKIRIMLTDLQNNVIAAVLLVMVVVIAALGVRSAALVGVAIPGSFLSGILVLYVLGFTINVVVLFALILAVGMLVDGAIVVTEFADRKMQEGDPPRTAYGQAAKRMLWPVIASTATTLVAFLPLLFWPGMVGEFMKFLPLTLIFTLSASLLMALIFIPTLGAIFGKSGATTVAQTEKMKTLSASDATVEDLTNMGGFTGSYVRLLRAALRLPSLVIITAITLLIGVQYFYINHGNGTEFFPDLEPNLAQVHVRARGNLSIYERDDLMREVETRILNLEGIDSVYTRTGRDGQKGQALDTIGTITLELADWRERPRAAALIAEVQRRTTDLAGIHIDVLKEKGGPPVGKAVQVQLSARNPDLLELAVTKVLAKMREMDGLINLEDNRPLPGIDWEAEVDRAQAAKFGIDINVIGNALKLATSGIKLGEYRPQESDNEVDIRVRYPISDRTVDRLSGIRISTDGGSVPISNFVNLNARPRVSNINRVSAKRTISIKAGVAEGVLADEKVDEIQAWLAMAVLDPSIDVAFKGEDEEQRKAEAFLGKAFAVALFLMAIILVTQFNSFYSAFLILSAVIMSTVGVLIGLLVTGQPFGVVMGGIGVIALAGIVVNNNIVLIDTFDTLYAESPDALSAILRTGAQRLRPVLLTTVTTILGLMPMVLGINIDFLTREVTLGAPSSQWWTQLSTSIVFGLGFATVLTLLVTPSALMARAKVRSWWRRRGDGGATRLQPDVG